jgi:hypothetical protein
MWRSGSSLNAIVVNCAVRRRNSGDEAPRTVGGAEVASAVTVRSAGVGDASEVAIAAVVWAVSGVVSAAAARSSEVALMARMQSGGLGGGSSGGCCWGGCVALDESVPVLRKRTILRRSCPPCSALWAVGAVAAVAAAEAGAEANAAAGGWGRSVIDAALRVALVIDKVLRFLACVPLTDGVLRFGWRRRVVKLDVSGSAEVILGAWAPAVDAASVSN